MRTKLLFAAASVLVVAACTSTATVRGVSPNESLSGTVTRGVWLQPGQVEIQVNGKSYRGEWHENALTSEQRAETGYPHRRHVKKVDSVLTADDGSTMTCRWETHAKQAEGVCTANAREYLTTVGR